MKENNPLFIEKEYHGFKIEIKPLENGILNIPFNEGYMSVNETSSFLYIYFYLHSVKINLGRITSKLANDEVYFESLIKKKLLNLGNYILSI